MVDIIMIPTYTFIFRLLFLALFCHTRAHAGLNQLGGIFAMEVCHAWCYFELYDNPYAQGRSQDFDFGETKIKKVILVNKF
jgi:hypothetical protein